MSKTTVGNMAEAIMKELDEYSELASDSVKTAVKAAAKTVKTEISANAPVRTGKYKKSWTTKTTEENSSALHVTVHSKNRYQIAHLLEHGHAKRNGGRVKAIPHIAPAEEIGVEQLERDIKSALEGK